MTVHSDLWVGAKSHVGCEVEVGSNFALIPVNIWEAAVTPASKVFILNFKFCVPAFKVCDELKAIACATHLDFSAVDVVGHYFEIKRTTWVVINIANTCGLLVAITANFETCVAFTA